MPDRDEIDRTWPAGWSVTVVAETGSTNADLLADAARGAPGRTVLAAGHQSAGRGRLDRTWEAPPGANLLASFLLRDDDLRGGPHVAIQRVSLAAVAAAEDVAGVRAGLKWPNDLLVGDAKLAGVLAQTGPGCVVVGIGVNVGWAPPGAARLGDAIDPLDVLAALLRAYDALPADVTIAYRARLATLGQRVRVELPGGRTVEGVAADVHADGRLVLATAGTELLIDTGDVVHLRGA